MPYSTRLAATLGGPGPISLYTVPASYIAVIRDLELQQLGAGDDSIELDIEIPGPLEVPIFRANDVPQFTHIQWQGRVVMNAADQLSFATLGNEWAVVVSGYLLSSP